MRSLIILSAVMIAPLPVLAQNYSSTTQIGIQNMQVTIQQGENFAVSAQVGSNNTGTIVQDGKNNAAGLGQMGEGHTKSITQIGNNMGYGSIQASRTTYSGTFNLTGGNALVTNTVELTIE